jgi:ABC-type Fe3+/spermidine/putrescine transport system ATPase subunit
MRSYFRQSVPGSLSYGIHDVTGLTTVFVTHDQEEPLALEQAGRNKASR